MATTSSTNVRMLVGGLRLLGHAVSSVVGNAGVIASVALPSAIVAWAAAPLVRRRWFKTVRSPVENDSDKPGPLKTRDYVGPYPLEAGPGVCAGDQAAIDRGDFASIPPSRNENGVQMFTHLRGRKLAKKCGEAVRRQMGCPDRRPENRILAVQRCDAWLAERYPNLRASDARYICFRAVFHVLCPCKEEIRLAVQLGSATVAMMEHTYGSTHVIPKFPSLPHWVQFVLGVTLPSSPDF